MRDTKAVVVTPAIYITLVGLLLWMTVPIGLKGLLSSGSSTSASLVAMGVATAILAVIPSIRKRLLGRRLPRANAIVLAVVLVLVGVLEFVTLLDLRDFAAFGLAFELIDKLVLLALLGLASVQLLLAALRTGG